MKYSSAMIFYKYFKMPHIVVMTTVLLLGVCVSCKSDGQKSPVENEKVSLKKDSVKVEKAKPSKPVGRTWRNTDEGIEGVTLYFNKEQCEQNKRLFERLNPIKNVSDYESERGIGSYEQYFAIEDLIALYSDTTLYEKYSGSFSVDNLVEWRLSMFYYIENTKGLKPDEPRVTPCDATYEGLRIFMVQIDSVLNYEPYTSLDMEYRMGLCERLYETFVNILYDRFSTNYRSFYQDEISCAIYEESEAFKRYREACHECAFALVNPTTSLPSTTLSTGVEIENFKLQALSLLYSIVNFNPVEEHTSLPGQYSLVETEKVKESDVLNEYARLARSQKEDDTFEEDSQYRQKSVKERRRLIEKEKLAWSDWLKASRKLSEYADKDIYQRSMNLVLKHKWRMLNNQYEDMSIYSGDQEKCFLGEYCTISQLKEYCYAERWDMYINNF